MIWILTGFSAVFVLALVLYAGRSLLKCLRYKFLPPLKPPPSIDEVRFCPCHPLGNGEPMFAFHR